MSINECLAIKQRIVTDVEATLAVSKVWVCSEVLMAVFDANALYPRRLVLTEYLYKQSEVSPESISMTLFVAANVSQFVDKCKYEYIVAVVLSLAIP